MAALSRSAAPARGFTLVELVITVTIVGVLAALALPSLRQLALSQYVRGGASDLQSALYFARSEAIKRASNVTVTQNPSDWTMGWTVTDVSNNVLRQQGQLSDQLSSTGSSTTAITYRNDGRLTVNSGVWIIFKTTNAAVIARCVVVDLSGRPSVVYAPSGNPSSTCT